MTHKKISAFIITFNEVANIERCLQALSWVDEIIIVDSESSDDTLLICGRYTNKIYTNKFIDFSQQKNFALSKVSNEWAFSVDADEVVNPELKNEIESVLERELVEVDGYFIKRESYIFGRWFNFCGTQNDFQMRLFKKKKAIYHQPIHEKVLISGPSSYLRNPLLHYTYESISDYISRMDVYTTKEADFMAFKEKSYSLISHMIRPPARFFYLYIIKSGFRDGCQGFLFSLLSAFYVFIKYAKFFESGWEKRK